jgi:hypothetical protein
MTLPKKACHMKKWILSIISLPFMVASTAYPLDSYDPIGQYKSSLESGTHFERDRWQSDRTNIKSGTEIKGYIKPDRWESDRFNFYDKNGRRTGTYLKQDPWEPERINIKQDRLHPN